MKLLFSLIFVAIFISWSECSVWSSIKFWGPPSTTTVAPSTTKLTPQDKGLSKTTYDWGQHTDPTQTTYNWGQHTDPTRTTYNWGQYTSSKPSTDDGSGTEQPGNEDKYNCKAGKYACKGMQRMCITLQQVCNGKVDCPHGDDEKKETCFPNLNNGNRLRHDQNHFAGNGFMFRIRNVRVTKNADVKLFNQMSDNISN